MRSRDWWPIRRGDLDRAFSRCPGFLAGERRPLGAWISRRFPCPSLDAPGGCRRISVRKEHGRGKGVPAPVDRSGCRGAGAGWRPPPLPRRVAARHRHRATRVGSPGRPGGRESPRAGSACSIRFVTGVKAFPFPLFQAPLWGGWFGCLEASKGGIGCLRGCHWRTTCGRGGAPPPEGGSSPPPPLGREITPSGAPRGDSSRETTTSN